MLLHTPDKKGYLDQVGHIEHLAWVIWLEEQWERPDRHDWYMMQLAAEIHRTVSNKPVSVNGKKLSFNKKVEEDGDDQYSVSSATTLEEATARAKAQWGIAFRGVKTIKTESPTNGN